MTQVVESNSIRVEEIEKEHASKLREMRDQTSELSAKVEALRDALDGELLVGVWEAWTGANRHEQRALPC